MSDEPHVCALIRHEVVAGPKGEAWTGRWACSECGRVFVPATVNTREYGLATRLQPQAERIPFVPPPDGTPIAYKRPDDASGVALREFRARLDEIEATIAGVNDAQRRGLETIARPKAT